MDLTTVLRQRLADRLMDLATWLDPIPEQARAANAEALRRLGRYAYGDQPEWERFAHGVFDDPIIVCESALRKAADERFGELK